MDTSVVRAYFSPARGGFILLHSGGAPQNGYRPEHRSIDIDETRFSESGSMAIP